MTPPGRYLLDTTVLIGISGESEPQSSRVGGWLAGPDEVGVCGVAIADFFAGLRPDDRPQRVPFIERLECWNPTHADTIQAGISRDQSARLGTARPVENRERRAKNAAPARFRRRSRPE